MRCKAKPKVIQLRQHVVQNMSSKPRNTTALTEMAQPTALLVAPD